MFYIFYRRHYTPVPLWKMAVSPLIRVTLRGIRSSPQAFHMLQERFCSMAIALQHACFHSFTSPTAWTPAFQLAMIVSCLKIWMKVIFLSLVFQTRAPEELTTTLWWHSSFYSYCIFSVFLWVSEWENILYIWVSKISVRSLSLFPY